MTRLIKNFSVLFLLLLPGLLVSCAGDPPRPTPVHLRAGTDQVQRGNDFYQKGCYRRALDHYFRACELYTAADQPDGVAMSMNNVGSVYRALGDSRSALTFFDQAAAFYRRTEDGKGLRQVLSNRAAALIDLGDLTGAKSLLDEAGRVPVGETEKTFVPLLLNRGILLTRQGQYGEAGEVLQAALARTDPGRPAEQAGVYFAIGTLMAETKRHPDAIGYFSAALKADRASGFYKGIADDLAALGRASQALGRSSDAVDYYERSLKIYALLGLKKDRDEIAGLLKALSAGPGEVTNFFVDRWNNKKQFENPCED